jgi:GNAT superfamily N-acetyltransferase
VRIRLVVREATVADARSIAEVQVRSWRGAYRGIVPTQVLDEMSVDLREDVWRGILDEGNSPTFVADDPVAGFLSLFLPSRDEDAGPRTAEIAATYVDPSRWGEGIGKALIARALEQLPPDDWDDLTLWVFLRNAHGRAFYARSGFRLDGEQGTHDRTGVRTARMRRSIEPGPPR